MKISPAIVDPTGFRVYADDQRIADAIAEVVAALPPDVREYIIRSCVFVFVVQPDAPTWFSCYAKMPTFGAVPIERPGYIVQFFGRNPVSDDGADTVFLQDVGIQLAQVWLGFGPNELMPTTADEAQAQHLYETWGLRERFGDGEHED